jgi:hypothetical protein
MVPAAGAVGAATANSTLEGQEEESITHMVHGADAPSTKEGARVLAGEVWRRGRCGSTPRSSSRHPSMP